MDVSAQRASIAQVTVAVANNSDIEPDLGFWDGLKSSNYILRLFEFENIGYFPACAAVISSFKSRIPDFEYVSICNVDLILDENFFVELCCHKSTDLFGVIAPNIVDVSSGRARNPKISKRPSLVYLRALGFIYSKPMLFRFHYYLSELSKGRLRKTTPKPKKFDVSVYAPHGAFIIFKRNYFVAGGSINFPRFLFSEELFVGEQLRLIGQKIYYAQNMLITDIGHGSTSKLNFVFLARQHFLSNEFIRNNFYNNEL